MGLFNKYNIEIDPNLLNELKDYVAAENIKSTIEKLVRNYIKQQKSTKKHEEAIEDETCNKNEMTKKKAMALFSHKNYELHSCVTFASTNKTTGLFWANPNPEYIKQDWSFILNDKKKRKLYLLEISKNTFRSGDIPDRDNGRLHIVLDPNTLRNNAPDQTDFSPYKIAEISY